MFTGIIEATARVRRKTGAGRSVLFVIEKPKRWNIIRGESVAVDGTCLTVKEVGKGNWVTELMPETLGKTYFVKHMPNAVNLERPLKLSDRLGGHLLLGHIDATGTITRITARGSSKVYRIAFLKKFSRLVAEKGSVAVDGISLTVVNASKGWFTVSLVDYTMKHTTLGRKKTGDWVNLEFDVIAKYLDALVRK